MCVWTKKRGSMKAVVLMATPCTNSLKRLLLREVGLRERWVLLKIPRGDIDGVGEVK